MADIKLFNIKGKVEEYQSSTVTLEKELQNVIENRLNFKGWIQQCSIFSENAE